MGGNAIEFEFAGYPGGQRGRLLRGITRSL
jgi:hypothetical protein